jgi:hypothetical protein
MPFSFADVVNKVLPAVVYITGEIKSNAEGGVVMVDGPGVIVNSNGYILTNKHVVKDAHSVVSIVPAAVREKTSVLLLIQLRLSISFTTYLYLVLHSIPTWGLNRGCHSFSPGSDLVGARVTAVEKGSPADQAYIIMNFDQ